MQPPQAERVDLSDLYSTLWQDPRGARLIAIALFCDTDDTGARSVAYFSDIRAETRHSLATEKPVD